MLEFESHRGVTRILQSAAPGDGGKWGLVYMEPR